MSGQRETAVTEAQGRGRLAVDLLAEPDARPGIAGTAYDTAWLAGVPAQGQENSSSFPTALQWLVENQWPDGSWGGSIRYEHDRLLCTLAALAPLARFGHRSTDRECIAAGTRYLWQRGHLLATEPIELVGFELLLPTLVQRAQKARVPVPPHLDIYAQQRAEKLRLIPSSALYSPRTTVVHSLEFLGDQADPAGLRAAQGGNGAIGNSPAATAFYFAQSRDPRALSYLEASLAHAGGSTAPVLHPCETFELLWAAYHLFLASVPAALLLSPGERTALRSALQAGGVSLSPTFPIPDADDTAVALLLLHDLGEPVDPNVLQGFATKDGYFASFPHERHSSVGVNLHVLHALLRVPGYRQLHGTVDRLLDYLIDQRVGGLFWYDKWHISPYYATAHALPILSLLPPDQLKRMEPLVQQSRDWLRQTQNPDGSWGFYGVPTAEETAYAVLALAADTPDRVPERDRQRCAAGLRYLRNAVPTDQSAPASLFPPMWIDKCLYTPVLVVRAAIQAARTAYRRLQEPRVLASTRSGTQRGLEFRWR